MDESRAAESRSARLELCFQEPSGKIDFESLIVFQFAPSALLTELFKIFAGIGIIRQDLF